MTERNIDAPQAGDSGTPEVTTFTEIRRDTFDSPEAAATRCTHILTDIRVIGERAKNAMIEGYTEAQKAEINLDDYYRRMQAIYDDAKNQIDTIAAGLIATRDAIAAPENMLPNKADLLHALDDGIAQAATAKADIIHSLEQQRERRPFDEQIEKTLIKTRQAFAVEAAAGTLPAVDRDADSIEATVKAEIADINANKKPEDLKKDSLARAEQYEGLELRARAIGLTKLLEERLAAVDATLEAQSALNQGSFTVEQLRKGYAYLESKKLLPADWRDPAKSGMAARFLGNIDYRTLVKLSLTVGALGAASVFGAGFGGAVATGFMVTRSAVSGVMGYFAGEKLGRAYGERNAKKEAGTVTVPEILDAATVSDESLVDLIARMEYQALISGKSLRTTAADRRAQAIPAAVQDDTSPLAGLRQPQPTQTETHTDPMTNEVIIDPEYKRLIAELQRRSEIDREGARSYAVSLETKIRQINTRFRELLKDRDAVDRAAMIGGVMGAAVATVLPAMFRGGLEAAGWVGGPDGSFTHGTLAGLFGKDAADWTTGAGAYSPDASTAVHVGPGAPGTGAAEAAAKTVATNTTAPTGPSGPPPAPAYANTMGYNSMPNSGPGWRNPLMTGNSPELNTNTAVAQAAAVNAAPEPGSFVPAQTEFDKYVIGRVDINDAGVTKDQVNNGFSYIFKRQLMDHAQDYGWDGKGDKEKWAMKKLMSLMKEVKINGKSVYDAQQLWATDDAVGKAYILEMNKDGDFSVDVYKKSGTNWVSYDGHGADIKEMPLENAHGSGSGSGTGYHHSPSGAHGPAPEPAPTPQGPGAAAVVDQNGKPVLPGSGYPADLAPGANNKVQWYDQAGFKSEGGYKDHIFGQVYTKAGAQETWSVFKHDNPNYLQESLKSGQMLPLSASTGLQFSDNFRTIKDFTGSVPNSVKEQLFNPGHPPFTGRFGRLADQYAQLRQAEYVLGKANPLNSSVISPNEIAAMRKAIARELAERVRKLVEFEGALKEDIRPARIFGKN